MPSGCRNRSDRLCRSRILRRKPKVAWLVDGSGTLPYTRPIPIASPTPIDSWTWPPDMPYIVGLLIVVATAWGVAFFSPSAAARRITRALMLLMALAAPAVAATPIPPTRRLIGSGVPDVLRASIGLRAANAVRHRGVPDTLAFVDIRIPPSQPIPLRKQRCPTTHASPSSHWHSP